MRRRRLLATAAAAAVSAGCGGYAEGNGDGPGDYGSGSGGTDDDPIDGPVEDLLLSLDALGDEWERETADDEACRAFSRGLEAGRVFVTSCAWLYDDVDEAQSAYETTVERRHKRTRRGSRADDPPDVGVETAAIHDGLGVIVVFRDANAVGLLEWRPTMGDDASASDVPDPERATEHAVAMHEAWRD